MPSKVRARAEARASTRDHHAAQLAVLARLGDRALKRVQELWGHAVAIIGPVERDHADIALALEENRRIVLEAIDIFGIDRCMFASNFPVDGLRVGFGQLFDDFKAMTTGLSPSDRRKLFHDNAARFYRLG